MWILIEDSPRVLEGACASEGSLKLSFISFTVKPPLIVSVKMLIFLKILRVITENWRPRYSQETCMEHFKWDRRTLCYLFHVKRVDGISIALKEFCIFWWSRTVSKHDAETCV
jgi:hypothetical protein